MMMIIIFLIFPDWQGVSHVCLVNYKAYITNAYVHELWAWGYTQFYLSLYISPSLILSLYLWLNSIQLAFCKAFNSLTIVTIGILTNMSLHKDKAIFYTIANLDTYNQLLLPVPVIAQQLVFLFTPFQPSCQLFMSTN